MHKKVFAMTVISAAFLQAGCVVTAPVNPGGDSHKAFVATSKLNSPISSSCTQAQQDLIGGVVMNLVDHLVSDPAAKNIAGALGGLISEISAQTSRNCNPIANLAEPRMLGQPFKHNGMTLKQMSGFPVSTFYGVPPIVSTADLDAAYKTSKKLVTEARNNYQAGETDLAIAQMYWARRIYTVAVAISGASRDAFYSTRTQDLPNGAKTTVMSIPPGSFVVIPGAKQSDDVARPSAFYEDGPLDFSQSVKVASSDLRSIAIDEAIKEIRLQLQKNQEFLKVTEGAQGATKDFGRLKPGAVFETQDGLLFSLRNEDLAVHNPTGRAIDFETTRVGHSLPRGGLSDLERQAGGLMEKMLAEVTRESVHVYGLHPLRAKHGYDIRFYKPNRAIDRRAKNAVVAYLDGNGALTRNQQLGENAYRSSMVFRMASDRYHLADHHVEIERFRSRCIRESLGHYSAARDTGNTLVVMCHNAPPGKPPSEIVATRMFYIERDGKIGQTEASVLKDKQTVAMIEQAMGIGKQASEVAAALPFAGIPDAFKLCFDDTTPMQSLSVSWHTGKGASSALSEARVIGWKPNKGEWDSDRILNCVATIPGAGLAASGAKKAGAVTGLLSKGANEKLERIKNISNLFSMPITPAQAIDGAKNAENLFKNSPKAAQFAKGIFDGVSAGDVFSDSVDYFSMVF